MLLAMFWQRERDGSVVVWHRRCEISHLQRATRGHPGEVLVNRALGRKQSRTQKGHPFD